MWAAVQVQCKAIIVPVHPTYAKDLISAIHARNENCQIKSQNSMIMIYLFKWIKL